MSVLWHIRPLRTLFLRQHPLILIMERRCHRVILIAKVCQTRRSPPVKVSRNIIVIPFSKKKKMQKSRLYLVDIFVKEIIRIYSQGL